MSATTSLMNPAVESVSAFFPCYNDEKSIASMVRRTHAALQSAGVEFEIIVVNDGSADGSLQVLHALRDEFIELVVVNHEQNGGYGAALRSGIAKSRLQWVFYTDGDAQYDPGEVVDLIAAARDEVDVVQGWKQGRGDPLYRKIVGRTYHHTVRLAFGLKVRDTDCDFRLMRRTMLDDVELTSSTGTICVEMMRRFHEQNARFVEVPVHHYARPYGRSEFFRLPRIARSLVDLANKWLELVGRPAYKSRVDSLMADDDA